MNRNRNFKNWRRGKDSNLRVVLATTAASKLAAALANGDLSVILDSFSS